VPPLPQDSRQTPRQPVPEPPPLALAWQSESAPHALPAPPAPKSAFSHPAPPRSPRRPPPQPLH
jgi:hypothetical protein